jgi:hypothetical protein
MILLGFAVAVIAASGLSLNKSNPVIMKDGSLVGAKPADMPIPPCYPNCQKPPN